MAKTVQQKKFRWQAHKPLLATALAVAGVFNMANAVLALGTAAGTDISNTATATYNDGNGNNFDATSNTVVIKVAEIAGLTAVTSPVLDADGGAVEAGDDLTYTFTVTNVGNAATDVFIPAPTYLNFTPSATDPVKVYAADGTTLIGTLPAGGGTITSLGGAPIAPDASFIVKVTGTPSTTTAGALVDVTLGNTVDNTATEGTDPTQNQSDNETGLTGAGDTAANPTDLRSVNVGADAPENGEREAQATGSIPYAASVKPLALAKVLKTAGAVQPGVPAVSTDDRITYTLGLEVASSEPSLLFQPAALEGTSINLDGSAKTRILVSDAIPAETRLSSVSTTLPSGWTAVYSVGASGDTAAAGSDPLAATWTSTIPADLTTVVRVGFVHNGPLGVGATATGLNFTVVTSGVAPTGGTIENMAQVFGETVGDTTNQIIYDASGDANPNNYTDAGAPPTPDGSDYVPGTNDGISPNNPAPADVDKNNDNTGTGAGGEINVVSIIPTTDTILNGTDGVPNAVGPTGDNDDFTNKSADVPAGLDPAAFIPTLAPVVFENTIQNPATTGFIAQTTIQPISPTQAEGAGGVAGAYGVNGDIPTGTIVTITSGAKTADYTFDGTNFVLQPGDTHVNVGDVVAGATVDYTVSVKLPDGVVKQLDSVAIPIVVFPDDNPDPTSPAYGYTTETTNNITIDRLYTGFMSLLKESRIVAANGVEVEGFTATPTQNAAPTDVIEYRITYQNISSAVSGSGSVTLTANQFVLEEDGNALTNTWAPITTHQAGATATNGTINYFTTSGSATAAATSPTNPANGTPIEKYTNAVPSVAPQSTGEFMIRRVVD